MRKFILFTSTLAVLGFGLGGAYAYNATDEFGFASQNDLPISMKQSRSGTSGLVTSGTGKVTVGYPVDAQFGRVDRGHNAADDFGFSDQNDLPIR